MNLRLSTISIIAAGCGIWVSSVNAQTPVAPPDAIIFFNSTTCPTGWSEAVETRGLMVLGTTSANLVGFRNGWEALGDREDRTHDHCCSTTVTIPSHHIAGVNGGGNGNGAKHGEYPVTTSVSSSTSGLPFLQLIACKNS